jgi:hypothetical protein
MINFPISNNTVSLFNSSGKIQAGTFGLLGGLTQNNNMNLIANSEPQKSRKNNSQRPQGHQQEQFMQAMAAPSRNNSVGGGG